MTTFAEIRSTVAEVLRDPDMITFTDPHLKSMVNMALAEIGKIAPQRFQEDIQPTADTMEYTVLGDTFGKAVPEIEVNRVELWDGTQTPMAQIARIVCADGAYVNDSQTGWRVWDGTLELPRYVSTYIGSSPQNYLLRVWGYAPYLPLVGDSDTVGLSNEREMALLAYCRVDGIRQLLSSRELFTQWQAGANASDVSPASLMNALSLAQDDWRRLSRSIQVLREAAG